MSSSTLPRLISLNTFLEGVGVSPTTGWRWRNRGILKPTNIYGRLYISEEAIQEFYSRATSGEFAIQTQPGKAK